MLEMKNLCVSFSGAMGVSNRLLVGLGLVAVAAGS